MTENSYKSPKCLGETACAATSLRVRARRSFHALTLVLLLPALYNYWEFDTHVVSRLPGLIAGNCRSTNILAFVMGGVLLWFLGMPAIEGISRLLRIVFAGRTDRTAWQEILYRSFNHTTYLAVGGAALWTIWVFGFYEMKNRHTISWAVAIPAHVLAASWYVPLIHRWCRLAVSPVASGTSQNQATPLTGCGDGTVLFAENRSE